MAKYIVKRSEVQISGKLHELEKLTKDDVLDHYFSSDYSGDESEVSTLDDAKEIFEKECKKTHSQTITDAWVGKVLYADVVELIKVKFTEDGEEMDYATIDIFVNWKED